MDILSSVPVKSVSSRRKTTKKSFTGNQTVGGKIAPVLLSSVAAAGLGRGILGVAWLLTSCSGVNFADSVVNVDSAIDSATVDVVETGSVYVDVYDPDKACNGTTLFSNIANPLYPRITEVDMEGNVVWEHHIPEDLRQYIQPGFDVELLPNDDILFVLPTNGIYEVDRDGNIVWSYLTEKVSHDADRLSNGNTLFVFGSDDSAADAQVTEIGPNENILWTWSAANEPSLDVYDGINDDGWTHTNAVTRMDGGNTLINLRNFNLTVIVNNAGEIQWSYDWSSFGGDFVYSHDPEVQKNGDLLVPLQSDPPVDDYPPYQVVELNRDTGEIIWQYSRENLILTRDANKLPNGNVLIVGVLMEEEAESVIFEVTPEAEIVWQLKIKNVPVVYPSSGWFYKAERTCDSSD